MIAIAYQLNKFYKYAVFEVECENTYTLFGKRSPTQDTTQVPSGFSPPIIKLPAILAYVCLARL